METKRDGVRRGIAGTPSGARAGSAMLAALFVVMMVAVLSISYLRLSLSKNREQQASVDAKRAFYIAEAGLSEAFSGLVGGKSGNVGSPAVPATFANGVFWVTATDEGQGRTTLMSTGLCGTGRSALSVVVEKKSEEVAALGLFADDALVVNNGCVIDSYDSRIGTYASQHQTPPSLQDPPVGSRVGSNADITVGTAGAFRSAGVATAIYGDARPGPQGSVMRSASAIITGSTAPNVSAIELPAIEVPACEVKGDVVVSDRSGALSITGDQALHSLRVESAGKATVYGPATVVFDELVVANGGTLEIDAREGAVKVYIADYLHLESGSLYSSLSEDPTSMSLLISASETVDRDGDGSVDPPVRVNSTGEFYGCIFAPSAHVDVPATMELFGALAAQSITVKASAKVHFDEALLDAGESVTGLPRIIAWRMVELPNSPLVALRFDPVTVLEAYGIAAPKSSEAHYDIGVVPPGAETLPAGIQTALPKPQARTIQ